MLPELPYHRFSNGDGILVVSTLPNGELPKADLSQASRAPQQHFSLLFWRPCVHVLHFYFRLLPSLRLSQPIAN